MPWAFVRGGFAGGAAKAATEVSSANADDGLLLTLAGMTGEEVTAAALVTAAMARLLEPQRVCPVVGMRVCTQA